MVLKESSYVLHSGIQVSFDLKFSWKENFVNIHTNLRLGKCLHHVLSVLLLLLQKPQSPSWGAETVGAFPHEFHVVTSSHKARWRKHLVRS